MPFLLALNGVGLLDSLHEDVLARRCISVFADEFDSCVLGLVHDTTCILSQVGANLPLPQMCEITGHFSLGSLRHRRELRSPTDSLLLLIDQLLRRGVLLWLQRIELSLRSIAGGFLKHVRS